MTPVGLPHSEISGSTPACDSPKLFAANHVLHRLLMPRHPPCALSSLTINPFCRLRPSGWRPRFVSRTLATLIGSFEPFLVRCHQDASRSRTHLHVLASSSSLLFS